MRNKRLILAGILFLIVGVFLIGGFALAQSNSNTNAQSCVVGNNACSAKGLKLAALLENRGISFPLIVVAGLLDGTNPCAIGMLILLLGYLLVFAHQPERMGKIGAIYIITIFITYFLIGLVFSQFVYQILAWPPYQEVSHIIKYIIIGIIWIIALINIKDFFWYGKGITLGVSKNEVPILMRLIKKVDYPTTILLGLAVTIFELPCSLPLYVGAIAVLSSSFQFITTLLFLFIYNLMFVMPLIVVYAILLKTRHIFEAKDIQERSNRWMKLSMGIAQILIGIALLFI
jgi:cytochrome c biogenesis protein CcdA